MQLLWGLDISLLELIHEHYNERHHHPPGKGQHIPEPIALVCPLPTHVTAPTALAAQEALCQPLHFALQHPHSLLQVRAASGGRVSGGGGGGGSGYFKLFRGSMIRNTCIN